MFGIIEHLPSDGTCGAFPSPAAYNYDVALAKLLEAAGISDEFISYLHRTDARPIHFDKE